MFVTSAHALGPEGKIVVRSALSFSVVASEYGPNKRIYKRNKASFLSIIEPFLYYRFGELEEVRERLHTLPVSDEVFAIIARVEQEALKERELEQSVASMSISPPMVPDVDASSEGSGGSVPSSPVTIPGADKRLRRNMSFSPTNQIFYLSPEN